MSKEQRRELGEMKKRFRLENLFCLGAVILIVITFFYPLWRLTAKAVQYETEFPEGLKVYVYLSTIRGDIYELNLLNKWIGAHFPERVLEHVIFPILFGGLALLCLMSIFFNHWKKRTLMLALILFLVLIVMGIGSLQWRLYVFGHQRDPFPPIADVLDFTVPFLGSMGLWNWKITTELDIGAYTVGLAALLVALAYVVTVQQESRKEGK
jgi:copper chaperone NosL